jgi:hypothetical protein
MIASHLHNARCDQDLGSGGCRRFDSGLRPSQCLLLLTVRLSACLP